MSNGESGGGFSGAGRAIEEHVRTLKTPIHNKINTKIPWNNRNQRKFAKLKLCMLHLRSLGCWWARGPPHLAEPHLSLASADWPRKSKIKMNQINTQKKIKSCMITAKDGSVLFFDPWLRALDQWRHRSVSGLPPETSVGLFPASIEKTIENLELLRFHFGKKLKT